MRYEEALTTLPLEVCENWPLADANEKGQVGQRQWLARRSEALEAIEKLRVRNRARRVVVRLEQSFPWDFCDLPPDLSEMDLQIVASLISVTAGVVPQELTRLDDKLTVEQTTAFRSVVDHGFERLSDDGRARLGPIMDVLESQLEYAAYYDVNPFSFSQYWMQQFDQYEDWEFARLARTESAFAQATGKLDWLRDELGARDDALAQHSAFPPIHPNCMCDIQPMALGDHNWMYLDTQMEPCETCNDLADLVLSTIFEMASKQ